MGREGGERTRQYNEGSYIQHTRQTSSAHPVRANPEVDADESFPL